MYKIQEKIEGKYWLDIHTSNDYTFICDLCDCYRDKYPNNIYRIIEVYIEV